MTSTNTAVKSASSCFVSAGASRIPTALKELMLERGVELDPSKFYRWVQKFTPQLEAALREGQTRAASNGWRMDEAYIKVKGRWKYLSHAVDKHRQTFDVLAHTAVAVNRESRRPC